MKQGAVVVMPRRPSEGPPSSGLWTLAAGWAAAARRRFGNAWILTLDGVATPEQARTFADPAATHVGPKPRLGAVPTALRTAAKDVVRGWAGRRASRAGEPGEWCDYDLVFVWQHHDLFQSAGTAIARRHRCPLVTFVDAPQVWEAARWGVRRPGWARLVERYGEVPQLLASDVIACVSDEVAREVRRLGAPRERVLVVPNAVDPDQFAPNGRGAAVRERHDLDGATVVGWVGTFRRFQGVQTVVEAFARVRAARSRVRLLLVGDGAERAPVEALVARLGVRDSVTFTGAVSPGDIPDYLDALDVAVVSARADQGFHYSPLKLREYLACARATVAPRVGEIPHVVADGTHALLYEPGDAADLAAKIDVLCSDAAVRARLGAAGRALVLATATWDIRLAELLDSEPFRAAGRLRSDST